jgi:hypothetical protein
MNPKQAAFAGVTLVVGVLVIATAVPRVATVEVRAGPSHLCKYPDGGSGYVAEYGPIDGGLQREWLTVLADEYLCVRRPAGGSSLTCRRGPMTLGNAFLGDVVGELNRFPANQAAPVVNDCERVACAVWFGEDADTSEATMLSSTLDAVVP